MTAHAHESHTGRIWKVFGILSLITIVEVFFGIWKPAILMSPWLSSFEGGLFAAIGNFLLGIFIYIKPLNFFFIALTVVKAYYIVWFFMHMSDEAKGLRRAVVWTSIFLIIYLTALLLIEGSYIGDAISPYVKWDY